MHRLTRPYKLSLALMPLYIVLVIWMSLHVPFFEAPDAYYHFAVVDHIAETGTLPPRDDVIKPPWRWVSFHAPLYYLISAIFIAPLDRPDFPTEYPRNPHAQIGEPDGRHNQNFVAHAVHFDAAVWVLRGFSMSLGLLTVIGVFMLVWLVSPGRPSLALLAAALVAFNPQFLFMHGVVSNDPLVTTLSTWVLVILVWVIRHGLTWRRVLLLALLVALASLAKASGATLIPVVALGALWVCRRDALPLRRVLLYAGAGLLVWLLVAGWWYAGNWINYGDPTATHQVALMTGGRDAPIIQADLIGELRGMYYSFWGLFGWFNIGLPGVFYLLPTLLILCAGVGLVMIMVRRPVLSGDDWVLGGLALVYVLLFGWGWWGFHQQVNAAQGRLLFPLMAVIALTLAQGLWILPRLLSFVFLALMLLAALLIPVMVIAPAYAPSAAIPLAQWQPPTDAAQFSIREPWVDDACLKVWTSPARASDDGHSASVDLWWQVECDFTGFWSVFLHWVDLSMESCQAGDTAHIRAQYDTMPSGGHRPFPAMRPGYIYPDSMQVALPPGTLPESARHLHLGLYDAGGSFIRAFVSTSITEDAPTGQITIGRCAPETLLYTLP